ncbi:formin-like protein 5 [Prionailurus viverrinus]|uniref:formin-like protein 5 n=1 Tax=Prionailurus viverrinus TaxID=61388 RepID=UPI001FF54BD2|nr:formin-like protein 5 [Prionailurus viverrinus]
MPSDHRLQPHEAPRSRLEALEAGSLASVNWKDSRRARCWCCSGYTGLPGARRPHPSRSLMASPSGAPVLASPARAPAFDPPPLLPPPPPRAGSPSPFAPLTPPRPSAEPRPQRPTPPRTPPPASSPPSPRPAPTAKPRPQFPQRPPLAPRSVTARHPPPPGPLPNRRRRGPTRQRAHLRGAPSRPPPARSSVPTKAPTRSLLSPGERPDLQPAKERQWRRRPEKAQRRRRRGRLCAFKCDPKEASLSGRDLAPTATTRKATEKGRSVLSTPVCGQGRRLLEGGGRVGALAGPGEVTAPNRSLEDPQALRGRGLLHPHRQQIFTF